LGLVGHMDTARIRGATVLCADIVVVAVEGTATNADAVLAAIHCRTRIAIVAGVDIVQVDTPHLRVTGIGGTQVEIVAVQAPLAHTGAVTALVDGGTRVAIIAPSLVGCGDASEIWCAHVVSTDIAVIASQSPGTDAVTSLARIRGCTDIAIVAGHRIGRPLAADFRVAGIIGTRIPIIAIDGGARRADARLTGVLAGAGVAGIAGGPLVGRNQGALPGFRGTRRIQAGCITARGSWAGNGSAAIDDTKVREFRGITHQRAIAEVAVFEPAAIGIVLALAGDRRAVALARAAAVRDSARVAIVADGFVGRIQAASVFRAGIIGAGVFVVTIHRLPHAGAGLAMVRNSTWVTVVARARVDQRVNASFLAGTGIIGTVVPVVAQFDVGSLLQPRLVGLAVTIVINAVACFRCGNHGIARGESLVGTGPLAQAEPEFVFDVAGSGESQLRRAIGTGTDSGFGHALREHHAIYRGGLLARKPPGAVAILGTRTTAEATVRSVAKTGILGPAGAGAIGIVSAGSTEVGIVGNADVDDIGYRASHLLAGPARRTLLLAVLGADALPQMLYAPAGLAVTVVRARVEKTAGPRLAPEFKDIRRMVCPDQVKRQVRGPLRPLDVHDDDQLSDGFNGLPVRRVQGIDAHR
jgi:hypothetical protein